jgi:hypothetical protein
LALTGTLETLKFLGEEHHGGGLTSTFSTLRQLIPFLEEISTVLVVVKMGPRSSQHNG